MIKDEIVNLIDGFIDDFEQKNIMRYEIAKVIYSALESAGCLKEPSASAKKINCPDPKTCIFHNYNTDEAPSESKDPLEELEEWLNRQIHEYQTRNTMLSEHGAGELHSFLIVLSKITSLKKDNK